MGSFGQLAARSRSIEPPVPCHPARPEKSRLFSAFFIIPENTIQKAPSAELRPNQKDQDSLPDYNELDGILKLYLEENHSPEMIIKAGYPKATVEKVIQMVKRNEYKRAQCPPIIKISKKAFGYGRKYPF